VQQGKIHGAGRDRDRVTARPFDLIDALELEDALIECRGLFEVRDLDGDVSDLAHGVLREE
jgi:hypothetical protein